MFVSEDFDSIWEDSNSFTELTESKVSEVHGSLVYRVNDLLDLDQLFIGVQSNNEFFEELKGTEESRFQIHAKSVPRSKNSIYQYSFSESIKVLQPGEHY